MRIPRAFPVMAVVLALAAPRMHAQRQELAGDTFWLPVTEAEKQMKAPVVDKDAGVEAIFWRVWVGDALRGGEDFQRVYNHYVRLKVFNEKGKEKASTVDLELGRKARIGDVSGRTIKPDGTIVELTKDAVHQRDLVKLGGIKRKAVSFAMPAVEPGAIVEYRWREYQDDPYLLYMRLQFSRDVPVHKVTYFIRPLPREYSAGYQMGIRPFGFQMQPVEQDNRTGYWSTSLENVPAFREEPFMPPEATVRPWALIYYHQGENRDPAKYWPNIGKKRYRDMKSHLKASDEVKRAASQAIEGATGEEEKVLRLLRYIRGNVRNFYARDVSDAERLKVIKQQEARKGYRPGEDVLKSGVATADEMNLLFAAMAAQVGLDARPAMVANQNDMPFAPELADDYFLPSVDMAVKIGGAWKLYDVSTRLLPTNMLSWQEEGAPALITDSDKPEFVQAPLSGPEDSTVARSGKLALDAEGAVEGDVEETWTGHKGADRRGELLEKSDAERLEEIKEDLLAVFPSAEVTAIQVENVEQAQSPLKVKYHIRIPGYAQRTGKRILLQPFFFQKGRKPMFAAAERQHHVRFSYGWREKDEVSIKLPAGFALEGAAAPASMEFGAPGYYNVMLQGRSEGELLVNRDFVFGRGGLLMFPREGYPQVKRVLDDIHSRDQHILSLRQTAGAN